MSLAQAINGFIGKQMPVVIAGQVRPATIANINGDMVLLVCPPDGSGKVAKFITNINCLMVMVEYS